jgi:hypothetical protein
VPGYLDIPICTAAIREAKRNWSEFRTQSMDPIKIESNLGDDQVLFLSDILPTGWMAAENANIRAGEPTHRGERRRG